MITVIKKGILSSTQGRYRKGFMRMGLPWSGPMDETSLFAANYLTGNDRWAPSLEMVVKGPDLLFNESMQIAICGAEMHPTINDVIVSQNKLLTVNVGDQLSFGTAKNGMVTYLAFAGRLELADYFGSPSANLSADFGSSFKGALQKGDILRISKSKEISNSITLPNYLKYIDQQNPVVRILPGPDINRLSVKQQTQIIDNSYQVSADSNRMGIRLMPSTKINHSIVNMISSAVLPGTMQLPESGEPIVMMRDHQTTGGYPRVATVINHDLGYLSQVTTGHTVSFRWTTKEKAIELNRKKEATIARLWANRQLI